MFRQITIVGVGLIGGSFALALRRHGYQGTIVGCDREAVLQQAIAKGVIDRAVLRPEEAIAGSDLVLLAAPVGAILDLIERLGPMLAADALLTDAGSTKAEIMRRAKAVFGKQAAERFIAGHPMAGEKKNGLGVADATLFDNAGWVLNSDVDEEAPLAGPAHG